ncbi:type VI secretion system protein TssA [Paraburkholderia sp. Tr-20389]|uniref:type VI secretion system protein TssA n=1 Tax=Paraburkholderia sp. Tr-20389 TaxID=2703903 RepID=UPI00197FEA32|nr:type VI secretion system ImpA family N-terminal domain-containing protein [Paraburkholderia sp. Tr-20389]MBN3752378.1 type VI secretion system protein TssA [Paraburkholderia sp. Tr-20389]
MAPVHPSACCGADLEYDREFVLLFAQVAARMDVQYGDFKSDPEPVNWNEIERKCRQLMDRTKDIRLAVLFTRCCVRQRSAAGLVEGLALLEAWLRAYPDSVHPQPEVDGDREAALEIRMNALQVLTDMNGLLADVRGIKLSQSSSPVLTVREVERAFVQPRPDDALPIESVCRQLDHLSVQNPDIFAAFHKALEYLEAVDAWNRERLEGFTPDLTDLTRILGLLARDRLTVSGTGMAGRASDAATAVSESDAATLHAAEPGSPALDAIWTEPEITSERSHSHAVQLDREAVLQNIREARHWFEANEPSSPIPLLLRRAEQFVGKRYAEVVRAIPPELLTEWENAS